MNTIYTLDIYKRLCELETLRLRHGIAEDSIEEFDPESNPDTAESELEKLNEELNAARLEFDDDEQAELAELEALRDEIGETTMRDGETMILKRDFREYAQELADDIGALRNGLSWPYTCIDWNQAADELAMDYSEVEYWGETYLIRA